MYDRLDDGADSTTPEMLEAMAASDDAPPRFEELWPVAVAAMRRAGTLERRCVAQLMREADPDDPRLLDVMLRAGMHSASMSSIEDDPELVRAAIQRLGERARVGQLLTAMVVYAREPDVEGAQVLLDRARQLAKTEASGAGWGFDGIGGFVEEARKLAELEGVPGFDAALERGYVLVQLALLKEARVTFAALVETNPGDARARVALWRVMLLRQQIDLSTIRDELHRLPDLEHKGAEYYELDFAAHFQVAVAPPGDDEGSTQSPARQAVLLRLEEDAHAMAALESDLGAVLSELLDLGMFDPVPGGEDLTWVWRRHADQIFEEARTMYGKFPASSLVYELVLTAALWSRDRERLPQAAALPVPPDIWPRLAAQRQDVVFAAAVAGNRPIPPDALEIHPSFDAEARAHQMRRRADAAAIAAHRRGDEAAWREVRNAYRSALRWKKVEHIELTNAAAVVLVEAGRRADGVELFENLIEHTSGIDDFGIREMRDIVLLNLVGLGERPLTELERIANEGSDRTRPLALALLAVGATGRHRTSWQRRIDPRDLPCDELRQGVVLIPAFMLFAGFLHQEGFVVHLGASANPWLLVDEVSSPIVEHLCST